MFNIKTDEVYNQHKSPFLPSIKLHNKSDWTTHIDILKIPSIILVIAQCVLHYKQSDNKIPR